MIPYKEILDVASGPTPWYMAAGARQVPSQRGVLTWKDATSGDRQGGGKKSLIALDGTALAVLDYYCYVAPLSPSRILVWFKPWRQNRNTSKPNSVPMMQFVVLDIDRLEPIKDVPAACAAIDTKGLCMVATGGDAATITVTSGLPEGLHRVTFPQAMCVLDELLFLCHGEQVSLWFIRPRSGTLEVFPQDWFNKGNYDFGYQWPTRVAREPATGQIVGDGIRIGVFILDSSNRQIERWLEHRV